MKKISFRDDVLPLKDKLFRLAFRITLDTAEAEDIVHNQFGDQRIIDIATSQLANGRVKPDSIIATMNEAVHAFVGEAEQSDDLTMLAIQYLKENETES